MLATVVRDIASGPLRRSRSESPKNILPLSISVSFSSYAPHTILEN
jgi:hypothetical protein